MAAVKGGCVEWALASRPFAAGGESGDACLVRELPRGALVAVADGLGHGPDAAAVARQALQALGDVADGNPISAMKRCHERLRASRGAVLTLAMFDTASDTVTWAGAGNVCGLLVRGERGAGPATESLLLRGGVLGRWIPPLRAAIHAVTPGDTLALWTDGVRGNFPCARLAADPLQASADRILAAHANGDDALVLLVRYAGEAR